MANFYEAFAQGQANGLERQKAITQRNQLAELQAIAPQVMAGDLDATSRAYALNPQTAQAYQTEANRQNQQLVGLAKTLKQYADNPQMQAGVYRSALPYLKRNFGAEIPDQFDAATVMPIVDQVLSVANNTPNFNGQTPTDVRSFQMMTQGLSPEDLERARRINLGLDGRASTSGYSQVKFTGADGRERVGVLNGRTGQIDLPDGTSFNPQTGTISQTAQQPQQQAPAAGLYSTPNGQVRIGEGITPDQWQLIQADMANNGASDNYQMPVRDVTPAQRAAPGGAFVGRAPEEQAALTEAAKAGVENANFPNRLSQERQLQDVKTQGAITQAAGTAAAEAQAKDASQRPKRIQQYRQALSSAGNVETSLDKALGLLSPYSTGFVGARSRGVEGSPSYNLAAELETIKANLGFDRLQQMRDSSPTGGALGAIAVQELVALQSTIANLDPNQSEDQIRTNLDRVKTHYKNWRSAVQQSLADEERAQSERPAASPAARAPAAASSASSYSNLWN